MPPSQRLYAPEGWPETLPPGNLSIEDLPITSPFCVTPACKAFRDGYAADEKETPLLGLLDYSYWTVGFYSFWILLFTSIHIHHLLSDRGTVPQLSTQAPSLSNRLLARLRSFTYRRPNNRFSRALGLQQTSYGVLSLFTVGTLFIIILPWPAQRLLRVRFRFGSPPLSVRCAMMISALTPLTVALGGKVNIVTWCTGVGYEKLNVWHRGVGYAVFGLASTHTIPHLIAPVRDGGWSMLNKLYENQARELSGTVLYVVTFGLTFASVPAIRRRMYEAFKYFHVFLAVAYVCVFFWHVHGNLCPAYIYTTVAILVISNIIRILHRHSNLWSLETLAGYPTAVTHLPGSTTKVSITVPKSFTWKPGQHVFLRIPYLGLLQSHPFSIANIPILDRNNTLQEMVFLIRRREGFTKKLFHCEEVRPHRPPSGDDEFIILNLPTISSSTSISEKRPLSSQHKDILPNAITIEELPFTPNHHTPTAPTPLLTIIDGPYGTHHRPHHLIYQTILSIAGGSGITAILPHILSLTHHISQTPCPQRLATKTMHLIWLIRSTSWLSWIEKDLETAMHNLHGTSCSLSVQVYVTRTAETQSLDVSPRLGTLGTEPTSPVSPISSMREVGFTTLDGPHGERGRGGLVLPERPRPVLRRLPGEMDVFTSDEMHVGGIDAGGKFRLKIHHCRPVMGDVVKRCVGLGAERAVVMGCGPPSLSMEIANTVAGLQRRVWNGGMKEVKLELETFGW